MYLLTGSSGFVGSAVLKEAVRRGRALRACLRHGADLDYLSDHNVDYCNIGDLATYRNWPSLLWGIDVVIHAAGYARPRATVDLQQLRQVNVDATAELARQAVMANVKRFVFISTVGVYGSSSLQPLTENSEVNPHNDYARTKYEAESILREICLKSKMDLTIIRAPMVYGKDAPGPFRQILNLVSRGVPLPLDSIQNLRSFVGIHNLVDFILLCSDLETRFAANQDFLVSDDDDVSTPEFFRRVAYACGNVPRLLRFNVSFLETGLRVFGQDRLVDQLLKNLQVDIKKSNVILNWRPKKTMAEQLSDLAK